MFLINIHQLNIVLTQTISLGTLEHQVDDVRRVLCLQRQDILILGGAQDLGQRDQVDSQCHGPIASVWTEGLCGQKHGYEGDVRVVHGLESDACVIAVEVAVLNQVFDGIHDLYLSGG